jgi:hypothetical protein
MTHSVQSVLTRSRLYAATLTMTAMVCPGTPAMGQYSPSMGAAAAYSTSQISTASGGLAGSVPSGGGNE